MDIKDFKAEIDKVIEENQKLQHLKDRYIEYAKRLKEIAEEVEAISREIDPVTPQRKGYENYSEIKRELFEKLTQGTFITLSLIVSTYSHISEKQAYYIMNELSKMQGVEKTKDGRNLRLFMRRA